MKLITVSFVLLFISAAVLAHQPERMVRAEILVARNIEAVWNAWTTPEGIKAFFAPDCRVDLRVGGDYEIYFNPAGEKGQRGAEGTKILALQPQQMLAFTWNNPPHLPGVRWQYTSVVVRLERVSANETKVILSHTGWGEGDEWAKAFKYFDSAWRTQVLPYLKRSLETGPIDWNNPPRREASLP